jgi:hypothetical protein
MTKDELAKVLEDHIKWLSSEEGGIRANLIGADLIGANLSDTDLSGANLIGADLSGANLIGADLRSSNLHSSNLHNADLRGADLGSANLGCANLRDANLSDAKLLRANLSDANLSGANLRGVDLRSAYLSGANLDKRYIIISCIGSRKGSTTYCFDDDQVWCGCFNGTLDEFESACRKTHTRHPQYREEYLGAINYIRSLSASNSIMKGEL